MTKYLHNFYNVEIQNQYRHPPTSKLGYYQTVVITAELMAE